MAFLCGVMLLGVGILIRARRSAGNGKEAAVATPASLMNQPLPAANLVDSSGARLDDNVLRKGRVILIFVAPNCPPCERESQFLKTSVEGRKDLSYYGVVSFGATEASMNTAEKEFPFKVYFDGVPRLAGAMGLYRVPIKVFVEDGIIRKSWKGASTDETTKAEFTRWVEELN